MTGHLNGGTPKGTDNVASLAEARRRAAERAKADKREARDAKRGGSMSVRDWIIGVAFVAMALGMIWHWLAPMMGATGVTR